MALEAYEHFEVAKELGEKENRVILTKSLNHATQLRKIFKKEHILYITEDKVEDQVSRNINIEAGIQNMCIPRFYPRFL